jgi:hypothetical protein
MELRKLEKPRFAVYTIPKGHDDWQLHGNYPTRKLAVTLARKLALDWLVKPVRALEITHEQILPTMNVAISYTDNAKVLYEKL